MPETTLTATLISVRRTNTAWSIGMTGFIDGTISRAIAPIIGRWTATLPRKMAAMRKSPMRFCATNTLPLPETTG